MGLKIGIDPGVHTGIAVWEDGKLLETLTVNMPAKRTPATKKHAEIVRSDSERLIELERRLDVFFRGLHDGSSDLVVPIATTAIETFENHNSPYGAKSMLLCAQARCVAVLVANKYSCEVIDVTKGSAPKTDANMFARVYGVSLERKDEHKRDAIHLSIIAGFDRKRTGK